MICDGVLSLLPPPIWNAENEHGWQFSHCASAAAIFDRLVFGLDLAELVADEHLQQDRRQQHDHRHPRAWRKASTSRSLRSYHAETASITSEPVTSEARITCT